MTITLERVPLQEGQQFLLGVDHDDRREWHNGRVVSREGIKLRLECPPESAIAIGAAQGKDVIIDTWRVMDARYTLRARVLGVLRHTHPQLDVELVDGTRIQHREYFRVPMSLDPREAWLEAANDADTDKRIRLHLRDISAGGLRAGCSHPLDVANTLRIRFTLPGSDVPLVLRARVVRTVEQSGPSNFPCEVGAAFIELSQSDREEIIRYALKVQKDDLKRGVI